MNQAGWQRHEISPVKGVLLLLAVVPPLLLATLSQQMRL
jgi:hypothetical protein